MTAKSKARKEQSAPESADESRRLYRDVSVSMLWVALGTILSKLIRLGSLFVVLKYITTEDLGVAQIAITVFVILQSLTEMGLGAALVRVKTFTEDELAALFWVSVLASVSLYVLVFGLAYVFAHYYDEPILAPLIQTQGLGVLFFALFVVPKSLLIRELKMRSVTIVENLSGALAAIGMMALAIWGLGIWALIIGEVGARLIEMLGYLLYKPYFPRFVWAPRRIGHLISFGLYNTGNRLFTRFYREADYLVIGKMFSGSQTGLYAFAFRTVDDIARALTYMTNQVAYPAFAKLQHRPDELLVFLTGITRGSSLLIGVVLSYLFVFTEDVLLALNYEQWLPAVFLIRLFCVMGLIGSVTPILSSLINALGHARYVFVYALTLSVILPICFVLASLITFEGVAWVWIIVFPPMTYLLVYESAKLLKVSSWTLLKKLSVGFPFPLLLTAGLWVMQMLFEASAMGPHWRAMLGLLLTFLAGAAFAWYFERSFVLMIFKKKKKGGKPQGNTQDQQGQGASNA